MSIYSHTRSLPKRFGLLLASFLQRPGLPFACVLSEEAIQQAFDDEDGSGIRGCPGYSVTIPWRRRRCLGSG